MKTLLSKMTVVIAISLVVLSAAIPANAQTTNMRVQIPFAFLAGEKAYPAGDYIFTLNGDYRLVDLRSAKESAVERISLTGGLLPERAAAAQHGFLLFKRYGGEYALNGVWAAGAPRGYTVKPSKAEIEMAKANGGAAAGETEIHSVR
ncbi:MAG: hypothetical protein LAQ30_32915 [Acidobacteriia bacterium]|nr:hypothetical protein [Terriglobia bacterium]